MAAPKVIDPIYKKYASRVLKYVASGEFYDYFMDSVRTGKNTFRFSNRKVEKQVDAKWVVAVENVIKPMGEIINKPRNFIQRDEIIVNVALAKQVTPDAVRHLATHGSMVDEVTEDSVRPNRLMQQTKEDSWNTYENKFVYTLLEMTWDFVDKRYEAIFAAIGDEYGAHLVMSSDSHSYLEHVTSNIDIRIQQEEDILSSDKKNESIFARIARVHRILNTYRQSTFAKTMKKFGKIKPPLVRTNAIAKNPNYKACHKLWDFILTYHDIGYKIEIFDQSPDIDPSFETDIYNSIFFNYIILKNNLEQRQDRLLDTTRNFRKKELKPKYIKQIVEEIVKNYDMPDVEIRKVLIEELTKAQLMQEEEKERLRLVAEKEKEMEAKRKEEEKLRKLKEKEEQKERLRQEKLAEKEALRQEKLRQKEEARLAKEKEKQDAFDQNRMVEFRAALDAAKEFRAEMLKKRAAEESAEQVKAAQVEERRRLNEEKKAAREKEKEKERLAAEKKAEQERVRLEAQREKEDAKLAAMKEREKVRLAEEKQRKREEAAAALKAEKAKERAAEKKAAEKERLAEKKEAEKAKAKAKAAAEKEKAKAKAAAEKEKEKAKLAAEKEKAKAKAAAEKEKEKAKAKAAAEKEKEKAKLAAEKEKEKAKAASEKEKAKAKTTAEKEKEKAKLTDGKESAKAGTARTVKADAAKGAKADAAKTAKTAKPAQNTKASAMKSGTAESGNVKPTSATPNAEKADAAKGAKADAAKKTAGSSSAEKKTAGKTEKSGAAKPEAAGNMAEKPASGALDTSNTESSKSGADTAAATVSGVSGSAGRKASVSESGTADRKTSASASGVADNKTSASASGVADSKTSASASGIADSKTSASASGVADSKSSASGKSAGKTAADHTTDAQTKDTVRVNAQKSEGGTETILDDDDDDIRDLLEAVDGTDHENTPAEETKAGSNIEKTADAAGEKPRASFYSYPMQPSPAKDVAGENETAPEENPADKKKSKGIKGFLKHILNGSH